MLKNFSKKTITGSAYDKYKSSIFSVLNILLTAVSGVMTVVNLMSTE